MAHDIVDLGAKDKIYLFGAPRLYADYSVLRFIALGTERYNAERAEELPALEEIQAAGKGLMVIVLPHRLADLDGVIERFPGGVRSERLDRVGNLLYVIYRVPTPMALEMKDINNGATQSLNSGSLLPAQISPLPTATTLPATP